MRRIGIVLGIALAAMVSLPAQTEELSTTELQRQSETRFDGTVTIRDKSGHPRTLRVTIQNWSVEGGSSIKRFPIKGFAVIQLLGGPVTTTIKGESAKRQEEEFWTLPPGAVMSVETENDTAVLHTVTVRRP